MAASSTLIVDQDEQGTDFDAIQFAKDIFDTIEKYRSNVGPYYNNLITTPLQTGGGVSGEHRLNTFLRLLGFPASRDETLLAFSGSDNRFASVTGSQKSKSLALSQNDTLNYFSTGQIGSGAVSDVRQRTNNLLVPASPEDYQNMMLNPPAIADAINGVHRQKLLPLVVDAAIPIYPLSRRVAPAFYDGDFTVSGGRDRLSRPFLEHIVYMRTKALSGASTILAAQIKQSILQLTNDATLAAVPFQFTTIESIIVSKLLQGIKQTANKYNQTISSLQQLRLEVSFEAIPVDNPNQRSFNPTSDDPTATNPPFIGQKIIALNSKLSEQDIFISSLPVQSLNVSDRIRRMEDAIDISNIQNDIFISDFTSIIALERTRIEQQLEEAREEEKQKMQQVEQAKRDIIFYSGQFTGLSIFDILCIFYALFTVDVKFVIGLLNKDAQDRLKSDPFFSTNVQSTDVATVVPNITNVVDESVTVRQALDALEKQVQVAIKLADSLLFKSNSGGV